MTAVAWSVGISTSSRTLAWGGRVAQNTTASATLIRPASVLASASAWTSRQAALGRVAAPPAELVDVLRRHDRVWQATPPVETDGYAS